MTDRALYYWLCWDNSDGTEGEDIAKTKEEAFKTFDKLGAVPFKKIVACHETYDRTVIAMINEE